MDNFADDKHYLRFCGNKAGEYVKSQAGATALVLDSIAFE